MNVQNQDNFKQQMKEINIKQKKFLKKETQNDRNLNQRNIEKERNKEWK